MELRENNLDSDVLLGNPAFVPSYLFTFIAYMAVKLGQETRLYIPLLRMKLLTSISLLSVETEKWGCSWLS